MGLSLFVLCGLVRIWSFTVLPCYDPVSVGVGDDGFYAMAWWRDMIALV